MTSKEDIEGFLARLEASEGVHAREEKSGLWLLTPPGNGTTVAVQFTPPVLVLRVKVLDLGKKAAKDKKSTKEELYRHLLTLNATDLVHGSYGIDGNAVVLTDALELENLDYTEFLASYDSMMLALASHLQTLAPYRQA